MAENNSEDTNFTFPKDEVYERSSSTNSRDISSVLTTRTFHAETVVPKAIVTVVGSLNIDRIRTVHSHVNSHEHVEIDPEVEEKPGGHGANQAVACMRLSHHQPEHLSPEPPLPTKQINLNIEVNVVGKVGNDDGGRLIIDTLKQNGVKVDRVLQASGRLETGQVDVHVNQMGVSRVFGFQRGRANDSFTANEFPDLPPGTDLLLMQLEVNYSMVSHVLKMAQQQKIPTILNAAPLGRNSQFLPDFFHVDHFILNASQADILMKVEQKLPRTPELYQSYCKRFCEYGAQRAIITLGEQGAVWDCRNSKRPKSHRCHSDGLLVSQRNHMGASDAYTLRQRIAVLALRRAQSNETELSANPPQFRPVFYTDQNDNSTLVSEELDTKTGISKSWGCFLISALYITFLALSCSLGIYFTVNKKFGYSMGDAWTLAGYIIVAPTFIAATLMTFHYPNCQCWVSKRRRESYYQMYNISRQRRMSKTVVDETGGSDAFIGAYAVEILRQQKNNEEEDMRKAIEMGNRAGAFAVSVMGSMESIPWYNDLEHRDFFEISKADLDKED